MLSILSQIYLPFVSFRDTITRGVKLLPCGYSDYTEVGRRSEIGKKNEIYILEMVDPVIVYKLFIQIIGNMVGRVTSLY